MTKSPIFAHFDESIVGSSSIRAYGKQEEFIAKCDRLVDESQRAYYLVQCAQRSIFKINISDSLVKDCDENMFETVSYFHRKFKSSLCL